MACAMPAICPASVTTIRLAFVLASDQYGRYAMATGSRCKPTSRVSDTTPMTSQSGDSVPPRWNFRPTAFCRGQTAAAVRSLMTATAALPVHGVEERGPLGRATPSA